MADGNYRPSQTLRSAKRGRGAASRRIDGATRRVAPTILASHIIPPVMAMQAEGLDPSELLASIGVHPDVCAQPDVRVPVRAVAAAWQKVALVQSG